MKEPNIVRKDIPLKKLTTFGVGGVAEYYAKVTSLKDLHEVITWARAQNVPISIIGGGSNILVSDEGVHGLVIHVALSHIEWADAGDQVFVTVGAGVSLDTFVRECVERNLWGIENMSGIPGTIGGVPIQNVGAYGVEAKHVVHSVNVYDIESSLERTLSNEACRFHYRDSYFKHDDGGSCVVTSVTFILERRPKPQISYKDLYKRFGNDTTPSLKEIRDAVLEIRSQKFPDWRTMGTAGSFFKNPIVDIGMYIKLQQKYPEIVAHEENHDHYKISLGWVLEHVLGLKGYREGNVSLYENQALVVVNHGEATSQEIIEFGDHIIQKVFEVTGLRIEREVVIMK